MQPRARPTKLPRRHAAGVPARAAAPAAAPVPPSQARSADLRPLLTDHHADAPPRDGSPPRDDRAG